MYERIVWQFWENSDTYPDGIPYIDLCHESVDLHQTDGKGYKVIRLNDKNYQEYIDDINPYIFNLKESENQLAQKADYRCVIIHFLLMLKKYTFIKFLL
jgi:hypothetical protein